MINFSRRQLAKYAVDQLEASKSPALIAKHLAAALIEEKMHKQSDLLINDIFEELENRGLMANAKVTAARTLSKDLLNNLKNQVKEVTKVKEVSLEEKIEPSVIGGFRLETSRYTWDKTIARRLSEIKGGI